MKRMILIMAGPMMASSSWAMRCTISDFQPLVVDNRYERYSDELPAEGILVIKLDDTMITNCTSTFVGGVSLQPPAEGVYVYLGDLNTDGFASKQAAVLVAGGLTNKRFVMITEDTPAADDPTKVGLGKIRDIQQLP